MNHFRTVRSLMLRDSREMADLLYFELMRIIFLYKNYEAAPYITNYADRTIRRPMNLSYTIRDTDLRSILLYFTKVYENIESRSDKEKILLGRITVDSVYILDVIKRIRNKRQIDSITQSFLRKMRSDLYIQNPRLISMNTLIVRYNSLRSSDMRILVDKISHYGTIYFRYSELTRIFQRLNQSMKEKEPEMSKSNLIGNLIASAVGAIMAKSAYDSRKKNGEAWDEIKKSNSATYFNGDDLSDNTPRK